MSELWFYEDRADIKSFTKVYMSLKKKLNQGLFNKKKIDIKFTFRIFSKSENSTFSGIDSYIKKIPVPKMTYFETIKKNANQTDCFTL